MWTEIDQIATKAFAEKKVRAEERVTVKTEIARSLLEDGMSPELVSKHTGLSLEEVEALKK